MLLTDKRTIRTVNTQCVATVLGKVFDDGLRYRLEDKSAQKAIDFHQWLHCRVPDLVVDCLHQICIVLEGDTPECLAENGQ